jgi:release factor glutamine methyltransferase
MSSPPRTVGEALTAGSRDLAAAGVEGPRLESSLLLGHLLGKTKVSLWTHPEELLPPGSWPRFRSLCARRGRGEPTAYLLGHREFWSMDLLVDPRVLIPRPETEHLVEEVLRHLPDTPVRVVDYGTGSGCIALALARERPRAALVAVDRDAGALAVAALNIRREELEKQVQLVQAASLDALTGGGATMHAVVSNPPYIPRGSLASLPATVRDHEPWRALTPGEEGLEVIRPLVEAAGRLLVPDGLLALEVAADGAAAVTDLLGGSIWADVRVVADLAGHPRVVVGRRRPLQKPTPNARSLLRARRASSLCG